MLKLREKTNGDYPIKYSLGEFNGAKKLERNNLMSFSQKIVSVCLLVFVFGLGSFSPIAYAATRDIYINSAASAGGDGSISSPYDQIADLIPLWGTIDTWISSGDTVSIHLAKGSVFREQLYVQSSGESGRPLTIDSYGAGDDPVIRGDKIITNWTDDGDGTYQKSGITVAYSAFEDEEILEKATDENLTDGYWYLDTANDIMHYRPTSGVADNHTFSYGFYSSTVNLSKPFRGKYITVNGLHIISGDMGIQVSQNTNADIREHIIIENCTIEKSKIGMYVTSNNTGANNDIQIINNSINYCGQGIKLGANLSGIYKNNNCIVSGNTIENLGLAKTGYPWSSFRILDEEGMGLQNCNHSSFIDNTISGRGRDGGIIMWTNTSSTQSDNIVMRNKIEGILGAGINVGVIGETENNIIAYNIVDNCGGDGSSCSGGKCGGLRVNSSNNKNQWFNNTLSKNDSNIVLNNSVMLDELKNNLNYSPDNNHILTINAVNNTFNYNLFYPNTGTKFYHIDTAYNFLGWQTQTSQDTNSLSSNPLLLDPDNSDFTLSWNSPAIDTGTHVNGVTQNCSGTCTDYDGNPIYGLPDIGAYEYQPPYDMGTDEVDISADVRVYGDGKFRNTKATSGTTADLSIVPVSDDTSQYLDIDISTWDTSSTYEKEWTETSDTITGNTLHTIGDLEEGKYYNITVDSATTGLSSANCDLVDSNFVCQADENGQISFTWTGGYSTHTFSVTEGDNIDSTVTNTTSAKFHTDTTSVTLSLTTDEDSTCKYSTENTTYDNMTMFTTTGETSHSTEVTDLSPGNYTYYAICRDGVGNDTSHTLSFEIAEKEDETDINDAKLKENNNSQKLNDDKKISYNQKETKIKGEDHAIANGTVKIYKEGKRIATVDVDGDGKWSKKIKFGHNKTYTLKIKFYDEYGTLRNTKKYDVKIDTEKPTFSDPFLISKSIARDEKITFTATDKDSGMDFYKVKLLDKNGHIARSWRKQDEAWYKIPEAVENGTYILLVRAYDKAGNYAKEQVVLSVGQETGGESGLSAQSANTNSRQSIEASANTCDYTVQSGDTLWSIAKQVYGDATQYQKIINLNPDLNSDALKIGQELKLCEEGEDAKRGKTQNE